MLAAKKYDIIEWIISVNDEDVIDRIQSIRKDNQVDNLSRLGSTYQEISTRRIDVEKIKRDQNYTPTSSEELSQIAKKINIEQPIEVLLADLKEMG